MMKEKRNYDLQERGIEFAVRVLDAVECLPHSRVGNHVAAQLIRAGTSPAPNYGEAQSDEPGRTPLEEGVEPMGEKHRILIFR